MSKDKEHLKNCRLVIIDYLRPREPRNYRDDGLRLALWELLSNRIITRVENSLYLWMALPGATDLYNED